MISKLTKLIAGKSANLDVRIPKTYLIGLYLEYFASALRGVLTIGLDRAQGSRILFRGRGVRLRCKSRIKVFPGVRILRGAYIDGLGEAGVVLGARCKVGEYSRIVCSGSLHNLGRHVVIGDDVAIGEFARIGGSGGVRIGPNTIIAQYFSAHPENHNYGDTDRLIRDQGTTRAEIVIGADCWIGAKATFLAGSKIGDSCVVAAGSVVRGEFPDRCVIGGVPARLIKSF